MVSLHQQVPVGEHALHFHFDLINGAQNFVLFEFDPFPPLFLVPQESDDRALAVIKAATDPDRLDAHERVLKKARNAGQWRNNPPDWHTHINYRRLLAAQLEGAA